MAWKGMKECIVGTTRNMCEIVKGRKGVRSIQGGGRMR